MKKLLLFGFFLLASSFASAQDQVVPYPEFSKLTSAPEIPEDLKGLVWNKWSTKNFIIISIDKNQGLFLKNNLDNIKKTLLNNWGIQDFNFKGDCKIVCVSDKKLLKRIFRLESPRFEIKENKDGELSCSIWFSLEDKNELPIFELMEMTMFQLENFHKKTIPLFLKRGICSLSEKSSEIAKRILNNKIQKFDLEEIKNKEKIEKEEADIFDTQSTIICLLFRKEYGEENFLNYIKTNNLNEFGIKSLDKFEEIINRYYKNLIDDLEKDITPEDYLIIKNRR